MNLHVDIASATTEPVPEEDDIRRWIAAALPNPAAAGAPAGDDAYEVSVRLVDEAEMAELNQRYRGKHGPTNVLSFPSDLPAELELPLLGDIVICAPVIRREALQQGKTERAHWAHMTVHGTLHLLGYDHLQPDEAQVMESLEADILQALNFPHPYETERFGRSAC